MNPNTAALALALAAAVLFAAPAAARGAAPAEGSAPAPAAVAPAAVAEDPATAPAPAPAAAAAEDPVAAPAPALAPAAAEGPDAAGEDRAPGAAYHGAGGPFAGAILLLPRNNAPVVLMTTGGYGYTYWLDGRLRLGGGGQGTVASSVAEGRSGSIGWGGLVLGFEPFGRGRWEFPLAVAVGGGRVALERVRADGLVERDEAGFFALQGSASVEFRPLRTVKLSLQFSWLGAIHNGLAAQALEASLRLVFLIPRPGH